MYRYNSKWHQIVGDYIHPIYEVEGNGFLPLEGEMDLMKVKTSNPSTSFIVDSLKISYLNKLIQEMGETKLVFVTSPSYYGQNTRTAKIVREICQTYDIEYYDFSESEKFVHNNKYFKDGVHMNALGADEFTNDLISYIRNE
jgi:hypothetical protein